MSDVRPKTKPFLELCRDGKVSGQQIEDFIEAWHNLDDTEECPLAEFLGMTEDEYTVWMASRKTLPAIIAARQQGRPLVELVEEHLAELQRASFCHGPIRHPCAYALAWQAEVAVRAEAWNGTRGGSSVSIITSWSPIALRPRVC